MATALAAFQSEVPVIPKKQTAQVKSERTGAAYSYTYADLATIAPVVMPLLAKHGLAFTATPQRGEPPMLVAYLLHTSGQWVSGELPISGRTPQEIGSSLTYGRRYLLGCLTGVVTDDDDDGALATTAARKRATKKAPGPPPEDENAPPAPPVAPPIPIQRKPRRTGGDAPQATPPAPEPNAPAPMHETQRRALFAAIGEAFPDAGRDERLALCAAVIGRRIESSGELNSRDASAILSWVDDFRAGREAYQYEPETGLAYVWPMDPSEPPP